MKNKLLKPLCLSLLTFAVLAGCAALEDKEVQPPKLYTTDSATKLDINNKSTFRGNYFVKDFTSNQTNTIVGLNRFSGGFVINYNNNIEYNYALKYGGYPNTAAELKIDNLNTILEDNQFKVLEDGYTIQFTTPIEHIANGVTYQINSIKKSDDNLIVLNESIDLDNFISTLTKLCDPTLPVDINDPKTCGESGAMNYVGYYRIDSITCNGIDYIGGVDFVGEMTASADLTQLDSLLVTVPITTKFQISNNKLKQCILTEDEINNSGLFYKNSSFSVNLAETGGFNSQIFANIGLISIKEGTEKERTSYIIYEPKNEDYSEMLFNNHKVSMKLRVMQQRETSGVTLPAPVTLDNTKYF